jgi:hypothetical protein
MGISLHRILVCDRGGQPHHWASAEDGIRLKYLNCLSYEMGDGSIFRGGTSRITGLQTTIDVAPIVFLKEILKYETRTPPLTNQNLFARDRGTCSYCGKHYIDSKLSRDHVIPTSKGGQNTWSNCVCACKSCNHEKADRTPQEAGMELIWVPYTPNHAERLIMSTRNILADQYDYIKAFLPAHSRLL